ncbi:dynein light chain [Monocercomonoides exilis]|uniref:dynein light chain n=1 Tax=Monocercomonoides exilis TaxID=2049356 RepID=UPI00355980D2|nr:dynein light chain [Monocercomonoides exilis]KAH7826844.1 dynein light chain [Monocercomonoides exilis]|eukprot:MONOS_3625.1-p1 / transcript=MONOS_3625.1 / gene=MONOS_3625 / organism=Monocercomonoides_exilis_PA203 / gene_product=dynein light chain / transcript_product=dynein light chain / location=Mono_scaffold00086:127715-128319(+) / protein_length=115 / sequence_SO=supercontig / SO=protein_coding / is_pseudo=false
MEDDERPTDKPEGDDSGDTTDEYRKLMNYPLIKYCDMNEEMRVETLEVVVTALEKCPNHYENAAKLIKDTMSRKFGDGWNAIVGEGFGFEISSHVKHLLFLFYGGYLAVLLFKAS